MHPWVSCSFTFSLSAQKNRTLRESQAEATKAHLALHIRM